MPWASDGATSFVATPGEYDQALTDAGLVTSERQNRIELVRAIVERSRDQPPLVDLSHVMGSDWPAMFGNLGAAVVSGTVAPV